MSLNNIEIALHSIGWDWLPRYAKYEGVGFDDGTDGAALYADEHALYWLNIRFSYYGNVGTWAEKKSGK